MTRVPIDRRRKVALDLKAKYDAGASIRNLAASEGMSFGLVRNLLREVKTDLRGRGGIPGRRPVKADTD